MRLIACLVACIPLCASESWGDGVVSFSSLTDSMGETIQARVQFVKSPADAMLLEQIIADIQTLLEDQSTSTINVARLKTLVDEAIDPMKGNLLQGGVSLFGQTLLDRFVIWKNEIDYHHQIIQSGNGVNNGIDVGTTSNERINISALGGYGVPIIQEMVARQASNRSTPPRSFSVPAVVVMTTQGTTTRWPSSMDFQRNYSPGWFNAAGERRGYSAGTSWIGELAFPITPGSATVGTIIQVVLDPDQKTLVQSATSSPFAIVGRSFRTYAPSGATRIETTMGRNVVWASDNQRGMFTDGSQELPKDQGERDRILLPIATGIAKMSDNDNQERSYRFDRRLPSFYNRVKDGLLKQNINWLKAYDVNANGYIEDTEMQIFVRDKNQGLIRAAEQVVIRSGMSAFTAADLNGDGKLSVSELAAIGITPLVESTEVIDLWMDPIAIQRGDMYTMAVRTQAPDLFNHYDQINAPNGKIDIVEYEVFRQDMENGVIGYTMALTGAQRTSADTNADGLISASEYSAYRRSVLVASITSGWNSTIASIIEMHDNTSGVSATDEAFYDQAIDQNHGISDAAIPIAVDHLRSRR
jgi:hypothetical protein